MSTYLRPHFEDSSLAAIMVADNEWDLDIQLDALAAWLKANPAHAFGGGPWVADIGFSRGEGTTVPGYTVSVDLLKALTAKDITLWLSEY